MEELVKFISESSKNHISEGDTLKCITILNNPSKKAYKLKPGLPGYGKYNFNYDFREYKILWIPDPEDR